jgi:hypothetical protein
MSIETRELIDSRRFVRGCEKDQGQRKFLVYDTDDSVDLDVLDALKHLEVEQNVKIGDPWPGNAAYRVEEIALDPHRDRSSSFAVQVNYIEGTACTDNTYGPIAQQLQLRTEPTDVWRVNPNGTAVARGTDLSDPSSDLAKGVDIGGSSVGSEPITYLLPMVDLTLVENSINPPNYLLLGDYVNTRNKFQFACGAPPGSVGYRGTQSQYNRKSGLYQVTHNFTMDLHFFHQRQAAVTDPATGTPIPNQTDRTTGSDPEAVGSGSVPAGDPDKIVWVQPMPRLADFGQIPEYKNHFDC